MRRLFTAGVSVVTVVMLACSRHPTPTNPRQYDSPTPSPASGSPQPSQPVGDLPSRVQITARVQGQPGRWGGLRFVSPPATLLFAFSGPVNQDEVSRRFTEELGGALAQMSWDGNTLSVLLAVTAPKREYSIDLNGALDANGNSMAPSQAWRFEVASPFRYQALDTTSGELGPEKTIPLPFTPVSASLDGRWLTAVLLDGRQRYPYLLDLDTAQYWLVGSDEDYLLDFEGTWYPDVGNNGVVAWSPYPSVWFVTDEPVGGSTSLAVKRLQSEVPICGVALSPSGDRVAILSLAKSGVTTDVSVLLYPSLGTAHQRFPDVLNRVKAGDFLCGGRLAWTADGGGLLVPDISGSGPISRIMDLSSGKLGRNLPQARQFNGSPLSATNQWIVTGDGISTLDGKTEFPVSQASQKILWSPTEGIFALSGTAGHSSAIVNIRSGRIRQVENGVILGWRSASKVWLQQP